MDAKQIEINALAKIKKNLEKSLDKLFKKELPEEQLSEYDNMKDSFYSIGPGYQIANLMKANLGEVLANEFSDKLKDIATLVLIVNGATSYNDESNEEIIEKTMVMLKNIVLSILDPLYAVSVIQCSADGGDDCNCMKTTKAEIEHTLTANLRKSVHSMAEHAAADNFIPQTYNVSMKKFNKNGEIEEDSEEDSDYGSFFKKNSVIH